MILSTPVMRNQFRIKSVGSDELGHEIGQRRQLEARRHLDTYDRLPQLKMPVYVCGGLFDDIAPQRICGL